MTETTQIEAGRELDALIDGEVFGGREAHSWWYIDVGGKLIYTGPRYSTTGDGMLAVLERMRALGYDYSLDYERIVSECKAVFYPPKLDEMLEFEASAPTLPHAVCLAALEAVRA